jgi:hypothetical protein
MMGYVEEGGGIGVETAPFLSEPECEELCAQVHALEPHWVQRLPGLPMYTLGAAAYLDGAGSEQPYLDAAAKYNPILEQHFAWLYRRLEAAFTERFKAPVAYPAGKALPGFHVFLAHPAFILAQPSIHADLQYRQTDWSWSRSIARPFSFTVALALPADGGGLHVWDVSIRDLEGLSNDEKARMLRATGERFVPYRRGELLLQLGHQIHRISTPQSMAEGDQRVTFQGHGLLCDGVWQIYW